jgi:hypothetical protein
MLNQGRKRLASKETLSEKMTLIGAKASACHARIDKLEMFMTVQVNDMQKDIKEVLAFMHGEKARKATIVAIIGIIGPIVGAGLTLAAQYYFR